MEKILTTNNILKLTFIGSVIFLKCNAKLDVSVSDIINIKYINIMNFICFSCNLLNIISKVN
jgi:hypothetical protein